MPDYKQQAAAEAVKLIEEGDSVGVGAGSTMIHLIHAILDKPALAESITITSSSFTTRQVLLKKGFEVRESGWLTRLDWYFDGCDQFDRRLNALKSGGGVHTAEKVLAALADNFILVGDASKRVDRLDATYPLVVEVIPEALAFVTNWLKEECNPARSELRLSDKKDGAVITERGNFLIDTWFDLFPDPGELDARLNAIPGILEHSLFYNLARKAIIAGADGITTIPRP